MNIPSTITIAANSTHPLTVNRLGYGTMRLTGPGIYGEPPNRPEALHPYPAGLVICTKVGGARKPDKSWIPFNRPENLRSSIDNNLRTLKLEQITLVHFRAIAGEGAPFKESMDAMFEMQKEGKILHIGVSNVSRDELETAMVMGNIATVENMYGHGQRSSIQLQHGGLTNGGEEVLDICEKNGIPLIPYFSLFLSLNKEDKAENRIAVIAKKYGITEAQANLAWLLHRSPWILPIPGTSQLRHFEENIKAAGIKFTGEDMDYLA